LERKRTLASYSDLPYGMREEGLGAVYRIDEERFHALKAELACQCFDNLYMPGLYLQITGKCNLKCRHCFSAVDNSPLLDEWSPAELKELFRQARQAGMCGVMLTGGEPTVYPHLIEALHMLKENDLYLEEFNTNGFDLKDLVLDTMRELGFDPVMKISLDGLGCHDRFRGVNGSETKALEAMRRCKERGFRVSAQTQVNRQTIDTIPRMLDEVESIGLDSVRLLKTTETPRWAQNSAGDNFTFYEYYREAIRLIKYQIEKRHFTDLDIWEFAYVTFPHLNRSRLSRVRDPRRVYRNALCPAISTMLSVGASGKVYPCLKMQGVVDALGLSLVNLKEMTIKEALTEGKYRDLLGLTDAMRKEQNEMCRACAYSSICTGGCVAMSMIISGGDMLAADTSCCDFFKTGIYDEMRALLYGKK